MNMKFNLFMLSALSALLVFSSCQDSTEENQGLPLSGMKVYADYETLPWQEGSAISVFDGSENHMYTAVASGESSEFISETLLDDSARELYALYPYSENAVWAEQGLQVSFPSEQSVSSSGVDVEACVAIAYTDDFSKAISFRFKELCSYFKFTADPEDKIVSVSLSGADDEYLAGSVEVSWYDKKPEFRIVVGVNEVTLKSSAPMSGTYVACVLPGVLQNGLTVRFTSEDGSVAEKTVIAKNGAGNVEALVFARGRMNTDPIVFSGLFTPDVPDTPAPDIPSDPDDPAPDVPDTPDPDVPSDPEIIWINGNTDAYILVDLNDLW